MAWSNPTSPNLSDFTSWVYSLMGVSSSALPSDSPWIGYAFNQALALTPFVPTVSSIEYVLAVYNCGGHILISITPDQTANATASFGSGIMTVTAINDGVILPGMVINGLTAEEAPFTVTSYGSGTGGIGTYSVSLDNEIVEVTFTLSGSYFSNLRGKAGYGINEFKAGVVQATGDESTSTTLLVSDLFKNLSLQDLEFITTPWGRKFLAYCQDMGSVWGLT